MKTLTLKLTSNADVGLEAEIAPEIVCGKSRADIMDLQVFVGNKVEKVRDYFEVSGQVSKNPEKQRLVLSGNLSDVKRIGQMMSQGEIIIDGDVGLHLGEFMSGGKIVVEGSAAGWIGTDMSGGRISIRKDAGSYAGAASRGRTAGMKDGLISIDGNAADFIGVGLAGGKIIIKGTAGQFVGSYMKDGVIEAAGIGFRAGYAMTGGKIVANAGDVPFYFSQVNQDEHQIYFKGDRSFGGEGLLCIKK